MKRIYILPLISLLFLITLAAFSFSCSSNFPVEPQKAPQTAAARDPSYQDKVASAGSWLQEWESTLKVAKAEGKVLITSTTGPSVRNILGQAFRDKFGNIMQTIAIRAH